MMKVEFDDHRQVAILRTDPEKATPSSDVAGVELLAEAIRAVDREGARAVVLCCGPDPALGTGETSTPAGDRSLLEVLARLRRTSMTTVAVLDGPVGGLWGAVALAMDLRVATLGTRISFSRADVSLPGVVSSLSRLVGDGHAMQLILGGGALTAERAELLGLVTLAPEGRQLQGAVHIARRVTSVSAVSGSEVRRVQTAMRELHHDEVEGFEALLWKSQARRG